MIKKKNFISDFSDTIIDKFIKLSSPYLCGISDILSDDKYIYIVQEYCDDGNLNDFLQAGNLKTTKQIQEITQALVYGIAYIHSQGIYHNNIKLENILVQKVEGGDTTFKLSDFGLNNLLIQKDTKLPLPPAANFIPPEFFQDVGIRDQSKTDLWQIGIVCYLLSTGKMPFQGSDLDIVLQLKFSDIEIPDYIEGYERDFLNKVLIKDVSQRMSLYEAMEHPYIKKKEKFEKGEIEVSEKIKEEALMNIHSFSSGNALKKAVLTFLMARATYSEQEAEFVKLFKDLDMNNDQQIDRDELLEGYAKNFPATEKNIKKRIRDIVTSADTDGDHSLNFQEFMFATNKMSKELDEQRLKEVFNQFDKTGSGYIDKSDLKIVLKDPALSSSDFDKMIDDFDNDGEYNYITFIVYNFFIFSQ